MCVQYLCWLIHWVFFLIGQIILINEINAYPLRTESNMINKTIISPHPKIVVSPTMENVWKLYVYNVYNVLPAVFLLWFKKISISLQNIDI